MPEPTPDDLARQARLHLDSLKAAGVRWLPKGRPPMARRKAKAEPTANLFAGPAETSSPASLDERRRELTLLDAVVKPCTRCAELAATRTQTVFGVGPVDAELCFVGEAPGGDEDRIGEPFVGAAGKLLDKIIAACGLRREEVYICNTIKCRPPGNRTPKPEETANCREYFEKQIALVRPKFICALGGTAAQNVLGVTSTLGKLRGRFHSYKGIPVLCTYHPAFLLPHRSPDKKKDVWEDMKLLLAKMGRPIPEAKKGE